MGDVTLLPRPVMTRSPHLPQPRNVLAAVCDDASACNSTRSQSAYGVTDEYGNAIDANAAFLDVAAARRRYEVGKRAALQPRLLALAQAREQQQQQQQQQHVRAGERACGGDNQDTEDADDGGVAAAGAMVRAHTARNASRLAASGARGGRVRCYTRNEDADADADAQGASVHVPSGVAPPRAAAHEEQAMRIDGDAAAPLGLWSVMYVDEKDRLLFTCKVTPPSPLLQSTNAAGTTTTITTTGATTTSSLSTMATSLRAAALAGAAAAAASASTRGGVSPAYSAASAATTTSSALLSVRGDADGDNDNNNNSALVCAFAQSLPPSHAPRAAYEHIVSTLRAHASAVDLTLRYVKYFDAQFRAYVLLTPKAVVHSHANRFIVIVAADADKQQHHDDDGGGGVVVNAVAAATAMTAASRSVADGCDDHDNNNSSHMASSGASGSTATSAAAAAAPLLFDLHTCSDVTRALLALDALDDNALAARPPPLFLSSSSTTTTTTSTQPAALRAATAHTRHDTTSRAAPQHRVNHYGGGYDDHDNNNSNNRDNSMRSNNSRNEVVYTRTANDDDDGDATTEQRQLSASGTRRTIAIVANAPPPPPQTSSLSLPSAAARTATTTTASSHTTLLEFATPSQSSGAATPQPLQPLQQQQQQTAVMPTPSTRLYARGSAVSRARVLSASHLPADYSSFIGDGSSSSSGSGSSTIVVNNNNNNNSNQHRSGHGSANTQDVDVFRALAAASSRTRSLFVTRREAQRQREREHAQLCSRIEALEEQEATARARVAEEAADDVDACAQAASTAWRDVCAAVAARQAREATAAAALHEVVSYVEQYEAHARDVIADDEAACRVRAQGCVRVAVARVRAAAALAREEAAVRAVLQLQHDEAVTRHDDVVVAAAAQWAHITRDECAARVEALRAAIARTKVQENAIRYAITSAERGAFARLTLEADVQARCLCAAAAAAARAAVAADEDAVRAVLDVCADELHARAGIVGDEGFARRFVHQMQLEQRHPRYARDLQRDAYAHQQQQQHEQQQEDDAEGGAAAAAMASARSVPVVSLCDGTLSHRAMLALVSAMRDVYTCATASRVGIEAAETAARAALFARAEEDELRCIAAAATAQFDAARRAADEEEAAAIAAAALCHEHYNNSGDDDDGEDEERYDDDEYDSHDRSRGGDDVDVDMDSNVVTTSVVIVLDLGSVAQHDELLARLPAAIRDDVLQCLGSDTVRQVTVLQHSANAREGLASANSYNDNNNSDEALLPPPPPPLHEDDDEVEEQTLPLMTRGSLRTSSSNTSSKTTVSNIAVAADVMDAHGNNNNNATAAVAPQGTVIQLSVQHCGVYTDAQMQHLIERYSFPCLLRLFGHYDRRADNSSDNSYGNGTSPASPLVTASTPLSSRKAAAMRSAKVRHDTQTTQQAATAAATATTAATTATTAAAATAHDDADEEDVVVSRHAVLLAGDDWEVVQARCHVLLEQALGADVAELLHTLGCLPSRTRRAATQQQQQQPPSRIDGDDNELIAAAAVAAVDDDVYACARRCVREVALSPRRRRLSFCVLHPSSLSEAVLEAHMATCALARVHELRDCAVLLQQQEDDEAAAAAVAAATAASAKTAAGEHSDEVDTTAVPSVWQQPSSLDVPLRSLAAEAESVEQQQQQQQQRRHKQAGGPAATAATLPSSHTTASTLTAAGASSLPHVLRQPLPPHTSSSSSALYAAALRDAEVCSVSVTTCDGDALYNSNIGGGYGGVNARSSSITSNTSIPPTPYEQLHAAAAAATAQSRQRNNSNSSYLAAAAAAARELRTRTRAAAAAAAAGGGGNSGGGVVPAPPTYVLYAEVTPQEVVDPFAARTMSIPNYEWMRDDGALAGTVGSSSSNVSGTGSNGNATPVNTMFATSHTSAAAGNGGGVGGAPRRHYAAFIDLSGNDRALAAAACGAAQCALHTATVSHHRITVHGDHWDVVTTHAPRFLRDQFVSEVCELLACAPSCVRNVVVRAYAHGLVVDCDVLHEATVSAEDVDTALWRHVFALLIELHRSRDELAELNLDAAMCDDALPLFAHEYVPATSDASESNDDNNTTTTATTTAAAAAASSRVRRTSGATPTQKTQRRHGHKARASSTSVGGGGSRSSSVNAYNNSSNNNNNNSNALLLQQPPQQQPPQQPQHRSYSTTSSNGHYHHHHSHHRQHRRPSDSSSRSMSIANEPPTLEATYNNSSSNNNNNNKTTMSGADKCIAEQRQGTLALPALHASEQQSQQQRHELGRRGSSRSNSNVASTHGIAAVSNNNNSSTTSNNNNNNNNNGTTTSSSSSRSSSSIMMRKAAAVLANLPPLRPAAIATPLASLHAMP